MSLSITNNVTGLVAQNNLSRTSSALASSLERLSSGLKVNKGADGPAALVIGESHRAQIAGLQAQIDNTNRTVSAVQTGEGALNEINSLLSSVRGLAVDSASGAGNDSNALAANQSQIQNALDTIDNIASTTQFQGRKLLDGSFAFESSAGGMEFQIGAMTTSNLGAEAGKTGSGNLKNINVTTAEGATAAVKVIDQAITQVTEMRGKLGAFQANVLESNAQNLSNALTNTTSAESAIRDTDFASETAKFTKMQVMMQAGTTVLGNANQTSQLVLSLLRG